MTKLHYFFEGGGVGLENFGVRVSLRRPAAFMQSCRPYRAGSSHFRKSQSGWPSRHQTKLSMYSSIHRLRAFFCSGVSARSEVENRVTAIQVKQTATDVRNLMRFIYRSSFLSPAALILGIAAPEVAKKPSGGNVLRVIQIRLASFERISSAWQDNSPRLWASTVQLIQLQGEISFDKNRAPWARSSASNSSLRSWKHWRSDNETLLTWRNEPGAS